jgi:hypothetical protein
MQFRVARWFFSLSAGIFLLGVMTGTAPAWANSVSGEAFGVSVDLGVVVVPKTPHVVLPPDGGMVRDQVLQINVPGTVVSSTLTVITSGAIGESSASAQSSATVEAVDILNRLVTARLVVAMSSSTADGSTATSNAAGSTLVGLTVNGVSLGDVTPPPNTRIELPGVGTVILNEQIPGGDGVHTTALTVNMIHVVLAGVVGGDIIVASAHSDVNFALAPPPPPPPAPASFMTGGGRLGTGRTIATFGFNARPSLKGQLQYIDHARDLKVHSTGMTAYSSLGGTCVTFSGIARVNSTDGFHFTVRQACDNGEPGVGRDTFEISVEELSYSSGYLGTVLTGGNLQLHSRDTID